MKPLEVMAKSTGPIPLAISFRVEPGELLALVGHSGSGKTTLLRTIAGLWSPNHARVHVGETRWLDTDTGINLPPHQRRVGMVFQNYALFPHLTAAQNVMAAMDTANPAEATRLLELVNLHGLSNRKPAELSGGEKQRVAVARALARRPDALLLDEPFSAVDRPTREKLYSEIFALRAHLSMPVVLVTHDLTEAQFLADHMLVIEKGHTLDSGPTAQVMSNPAALRAMGLHDVASLLPATVAEHLPDGLSRLDTLSGPLFVPIVDVPPGTALRLRILAQDVILALARPVGLSAQNILQGRIAKLTPGIGPGMMVHVALGDHLVLARITRRAADQMALAPGQSVHLIIKSLSISRG